MNRIEIMGILCACVFAALGFMESGVIAAMGVVLFSLIATAVFMGGEENKRRSFARTKKAVIRYQLRKNNS